MRKRTLAALSLVLAALSGCGSGDDSGPGITFVRGVHVVPDAAAVNAELDAYIVAAALAFGTVTPFSIDSFDGGSVRRVVRVATLLPDLTEGEVLLEEEVTLTRNTEATFVFHGAAADMRLLLVETPRRLRPLAGFYLQFAHVATAAGPLDVYATAPDTDLASTAPLVTVDPESYTPSVEVPSGERRIRLAPAGTLDVIYDSGTVRFGNEVDDSVTGVGDELLMTITDSVVAGGPPLKLLVGTGAGGFATFADDDAVAGLRTVHASVDTPAFDVVVGDDFGSPLATDLSYTDAGPMAVAPRGVINLNFTAPGSSTDFVLEEEVELTADREHTLWVYDDFERAKVLTLAADRRSIATEAKLRLVHAAPDADFFSLYVGEEASDPPDTADRSIRDLAFGQASVYRSFLPGAYKLTLTERFYVSGTNPNDAEETVVIGPLDVVLEGGDVTTLLLLPPQIPGDPEVLEVYDDTGP